MNDPTNIAPRKLRFGLRALLVAIGCVALLLGLGRWFALALGGAREAARQTQCRCHFSQLMLALTNYHDHFGTFPPAHVSDANGKPIHSWRVLILPYLEQKGLFDAYDFDEAWDGPNNRRLAGSMPEIYRCSSESPTRPRHLTNYVAVVGAETAFPGPIGLPLSDFPHEGENTLLLAEVTHEAIHWMEPRDLNFDSMSFQINDRSRPSISSVHPKGPGIVCARSIPCWRWNPNASPDLVRALIVRQSGGEVTVEKLVEQGWLRR